MTFKPVATFEEVVAIALGAAVDGPTGDTGAVPPVAPTEPAVVN